LKYQKGPNHWTVKVSKIYEMFIGKLADGGFCVSRKMKEFLKTKNIEAIVLYDRPPMNFKPLGKEERTQTFMDLGNELENLLPWNIFPEVKTPAELFNHKNRPIIGVSSTSWTKDENFGLLLGILVELNSFLEKNNQSVVFFITGKGECKDPFLKELETLPITHIKVLCLWLKIEDYPRLLGSCDFGLSFHESSSGLDLPMKVVDMFGCGLPVIAHDFITLPELVNEKNGASFTDSNELLNHLKKFILNENLRQDLKLGALKFRERTWAMEWGEKFTKLISL